MSDHEKNENELLLDHEYDGLKELDNPLPGWWLGTFYIAIAFTIFYIPWFHFGEGNTLRDTFVRDIQIAEEYASKFLGVKPIDIDRVMAAANDPSMIEKGAKVFQQNCVSCHGASAEGGIGPNLTDDYWINGNGQVNSIAEIIMGGVLEKGMPVWGLKLLEDEIYGAAAYVNSTRGSNPANAKEPQGELMSDPANEPSDVPIDESGE